MPVYLIRAGNSGPVKIGKADNPSFRMSEFQVGHYEQLRLVRVWEGGYAEEAALHLRFADLRVRGEWFSFSRAMLGDVGLREIPIPEVAAPLPAPVPEGLRAIETDIVTRVRAFCIARGMTEREFGFAVANNHKLLPRIRAGFSVHSSTQDRINAFLSGQAA